MSISDEDDIYQSDDIDYHDDIEPVVQRLRRFELIRPVVLRHEQTRRKWSILTRTNSSYYSTDDEADTYYRAHVVAYVRDMRILAEIQNTPVLKFRRTFNDDTAIPVDGSTDYIINLDQDLGDAAYVRDISDMIARDAIVLTHVVGDVRLEDYVYL